jgi:bifunctional DNA-binding transcriptional regulator/antitoxin component of YhaV-PrlF toxin-antitoxin module
MEFLDDSKLTKEFQATAPKCVRELLKLGTDDRLVFVKDCGQIALKRRELKFEP